MTSLRRLHQVELRRSWLSEPGRFTPWLAGEENLSPLADTLGIELEAQERDVGWFQAEIVCKETTDRTLVLIENQLEKTDHTHLSKLMTSGLLPKLSSSEMQVAGNSLATRGLSELEATHGRA